MGAARSKVRAMGFHPPVESADTMLTLLDDLARQEPDLLACQWYSRASDRQIRLFKREWQQWKRGKHEE
jgi:hypothetical protein